MPTYEWFSHFRRDWDALDEVQKKAFLDAVKVFVEDLRKGAGFQSSLRVKKMQGHAGIWEMSWAADGRATFEFGDEVSPGEVHIVWRRIGKHDIFGRP
jgi:mRNA-degrading endonuclease YafQ of YafQ-DinJ toxin-antitoxin module